MSKKKKTLGWMTIVLIMVASVVLTVVLAIDVNNDSGGAVKFDMIETLCSLLSGAASVILGVVAIVQEQKANRLNEELAEIDRMQFENASATANYPLIKFRKTQVVDVKKKEFVLSFVDVKEVVIKEMYVSDMHIYPYTEDYREREEEESILIQKDGERAKAKMAPAVKRKGFGAAARRKKYSVSAKGWKVYRRREGVYEATVKVDPEVFTKFPRYCLEFNLDVVNAAEVAVIYRFKLMMKGAGEMRKMGAAKRMRPKVFHQFYEIEATMGEEKWEEK